jgi:tetratricopeptide (TPR) repeat protein
MKQTIVIFGLLLLSRVVTPQSDFELVGVVRATDQSVIAGVMVKIISRDFRTTGESGEFRIPIPRNMIGQKINLSVVKKGWVVDDPRELMLIVPADPSQNPVRITMRQVSTRDASRPRIRSGNAAAQIHRLMDVATLLKNDSLFGESLKKYQAALAVARSGKFWSEEIECLDQIGLLQLLSGDYALARETFTLLQALATEHRSAKHFNRALLNLGDLERLQGNCDLARQHYLEARSLFQRERDRLGWADVLRAMGELESLQGNNDLARQYFADARGFYLEENSKLGEVYVLKELGDLESRQGNNDLARQHYADAKVRFQGEGKRLGEANVLFGLENWRASRSTTIRPGNIMTRPATSSTE